jgi:16S rRNA G966 N2-methylase RsmD
MARAPAASFELVLLDPPFDAGLTEAAVRAAWPLLVPGGFLYLEAAAPMGALPVALLSYRQLRAGAVHAQLLQRAE